MELSTPLNQAHFLGRQADKLVRTGKFEEAVNLQDKITECLQEALKEATNNKVIESLELQIKFHQKQKDVIGQRKKRCEKFSKELKNLKIKMEKANLAAADGLQDSIFRTFQETESLLQHLRVGTTAVEDDSVPSDPSTGAKMPKDDKIIIEELQTANNHLRGMVEAMFAELETYKRENAELRAKVSDLEAEKLAKTMIGGANLGLGVEQAGLQDSGHLPDLAPLEMPQFEFPVQQQDLKEHKRNFD